MEAASATPMLIVGRIRCPSSADRRNSHTRRMRSATTTALSSGVSAKAVQIRRRPTCRRYHRRFCSIATRTGLAKPESPA
ncbi:MAG: hypothetical protein MZV64_60585 [Ignavibacteriales bacterium]|nr:hypothetical protein [Ignavibacteriales bacterium]